jgi:DNA-binding CsgD family transcriptional regulator/PAS domain-containing protein
MRDELQLAGLIGDIYGAALQPEQWPGVLDRVSDAFGGAAVIMAVQNLPRGAGFVAMSRLDAALLPLFQGRYADLRHNPPLANLMRRPTGTAVIGKEFHDRRELFRTDLYNDLMRPQRLQDGAMAMLLRERDHVALVSLMQREGAERFDERDRDHLNLLVPHLQRSLLVFLRLGVLDADRHAARAALDRLPMGVALVGGNGRVLQLNRAAEAIVAAGDGLRVDQDGLRAATQRETRALRRLVADAAGTGNGGGTGAGGVVSLSRPSSSRPLSVLVAPLPGGRLVDEGWPAAIVFVSDPEQEATAPADLLARLYGLTRAEAALAALLLQGREPAEAADELGVTMNTVRTHLKRVFDKTGARRQAELVRLLLRGPAGLRPA